MKDKEKLREVLGKFWKSIFGKRGDRGGDIHGDQKPILVSPNTEFERETDKSRKKIKPKEKQLSLPLSIKSTPRVDIHATMPEKKPTVKRKPSTTRKQSINKPLTAKHPKVDFIKWVSYLRKKYKLNNPDPPFYNDWKKWSKDNFEPGPPSSEEEGIQGRPLEYTYKGMDLAPYGWRYGNSHYSQLIRPGDEVFGTVHRAYAFDFVHYWNYHLSEKLEYEAELKRREELQRQKRLSRIGGTSNVDTGSISMSEIKSVIDELVKEELTEINYTQDSGGRNVIAVGAPGSLARFKAEHPHMDGPYTVYVKTGRLSGQTVFANRDKDTGVYYYLNPDTGHDEPIGTEKDLSVQRKQQEGVGYVTDKDMAKDPKHIKGERWRIKFQSDSDLKKHGDTETSKVDEDGVSPKKKDELEKEKRLEKTLALMIRAKPQDTSIPEPVERPESDFMKRIKSKIPKDTAKPWNQLDAFDEDTIKLSEVKTVIKELVDEMWDSKNDVNGDETHEDKPNINEILNTYDDFIELVKSLPESEIKKIYDISNSRKISVYDAILEYLRQLNPSSKSATKKKSAIGESSNIFQPLKNNKNDIADLIFSLKEGTGIWFSQDNITGHQGDNEWIEKRVEGDEYVYIVGNGENPRQYLNTDGEIIGFADELVNREFKYYTIQHIQGYEEHSPQKPYHDDDQQPGHYELYGPDQLKPQFEVAPSGWEGTVKTMKKHKDIDNPWALTHWMKNKGYKSHKKDEGVLNDPFKSTENITDFAKPRMFHSISRPVRKPETNEWVVKWMTNGKRDENKTYYTDDKQDAFDTYTQMVKNANDMNKSGK